MPRGKKLVIGAPDDPVDGAQGVIPTDPEGVAGQPIPGEGGCDAENFAGQPTPQPVICLESAALRRLAGQLDEHLRTSVDVGMAEVAERRVLIEVLRGIAATGVPLVLAVPLPEHLAEHEGLNPILTTVVMSFGQEEPGDGGGDPA